MIFVEVDEIQYTFNHFNCQL